MFWDDGVAEEQTLASDFAIYLSTVQKTQENAVHTKGQKQKAKFNGPSKWYILREEDTESPGSALKSKWESTSDAAAKKELLGCIKKSIKEHKEAQEEGNKDSCKFILKHLKRVDNEMAIGLSSDEEGTVDLVSDKTVAKLCEDAPKWKQIRVRGSRYRRKHEGASD
ncbi:hypothetical protein M434DRAFT_27709 [Hypoxylon sp. CO27-5]|nr:hypothetical protein M434DRAFT_27709 [Hypoxylon sp. CO27-5]